MYELAGRLSYREQPQKSAIHRPDPPSWLEAPVQVAPDPPSWLEARPPRPQDDEDASVGDLDEYAVRRTSLGEYAL